MLSTTTKRRAKGQSSKRKAGSAEIGSNKKQSRGNTKSGAVSNPELVIGIDFGTSSTAVAWVGTLEDHIAHKPPARVEPISASIE